MKIYIVYLRTFENSPEVEIISVTTEEGKAKAAMTKAKEMEKEWMKDADENSCDWAEACMVEHDVAGDFKAGDSVGVSIITSWVDYVRTEVQAFHDLPSASNHISERKKLDLDEWKTLLPFDEDETIEESMHLVDESVMIDIYYSSELVTLE